MPRIALTARSHDRLDDNALSADSGPDARVRARTPAAATHGAAPAPRLQTLVAARGIVSVMVLLFHASGSILPLRQFWGKTVLGGILNFPYGRIAFFLVLSGYLIGHLHTRDFGKPARLLLYAVSRFRSIYPMYWVVLVIVVLIGLSPIGWRPENNPSATKLLSSAALVGPDAQSNVLGVAWTLYHQILFYAVFGLLVLNRRLGLLAVAAWMMLFAAARLGAAPGWVPDYVTQPVNLLFLFGFVASQMAARNRVPAPRLLVAGSALFIGCMIARQLAGPTDVDAQRLLIGLAWAVMLAALTTIETRHRIRVPRVMIELGAASYVLYLTHFTVLLALAKLAAHRGWNHVIPVEIAFVVMVAISLGVALLVHRLVERPLAKWVRGANGRPQSRPMALAE